MHGPIITNIVTTDIERAKKFYLETLGLKLVADLGPALRIDAGGAPLFIYQRDTPPHADHTVASWDVDDLAATVAQLRDRGITMQRYDGYGQDEAGIASRGPDGPRMAWFKDPDGNTLGLFQA